MLNFHLNWFSTVLSDIFGVSRFTILDGNCLFRAKFLGFWGLNRGQISIFHFITPKRHILARFRVFWAIARQNPSRGLFSTLFREKRKEKKSHTKSYISPLCPEVPRELIFTKFGTNVHLVDVINPDKLCVNLFKGFDFTVGQIFHFSHRKLTSPL